MHSFIYKQDNALMDITIVESKEYLADLLYGENDKRKKERLQFLYWHKTGLATTRSRLAALLCKSLPTITAWARRYESLGLEGFLGMDYKGGEHLRVIPRAVVAELDARLGTAEGFGSFAEIQSWLKEEHGVEVAYSTVHGLVRYGLNASPKVVRPFSENQDPEAVDAFKKTRRAVGRDRPTLPCPVRPRPLLGPRRKQLQPEDGVAQARHPLRGQAAGEDQKHPRRVFPVRRGRGQDGGVLLS